MVRGVGFGGDFVSFENRTCFRGFQNVCQKVPDEGNVLFEVAYLVFEFLSTESLYPSKGEESLAVRRHDGPCLLQYIIEDSSILDFRRQKWIPFLL